MIVLPGIYTGDGNRDLTFNGKAIEVTSIDSQNPQNVADTIIDCEGKAGGSASWFPVQRCGGQGYDTDWPSQFAVVTKRSVPEFFANSAVPTVRQLRIY